MKELVDISKTAMPNETGLPPVGGTSKNQLTRPNG